jgi:hypothetical protein
MKNTGAETVDTADAVAKEWGEEPSIIPFVDEPSVRGRAVEPQDLGESADEEFGLAQTRTSVVDRDLGLESVQRVSTAGHRRYACPCCGQGASRVMRVRVANAQQNQARWVALCALCAASMLVRIPGTIVGGMVRPTRRKPRNPVLPERRIAHGFRSGARSDRYRRAG